MTSLFASAKEMTLRDIEKFGGKIFHLDLEHAHARREKIVKHLRGNRRDQTDRGRDERFRNSRRDRLDARRMRRRQSEKCGHDSPHRAEQPDKWARGAGRREKRDSIFELGE